MNLLKKLKEVVIAILPVVVICLFIHFFISPFSTRAMWAFIISVCLVVIGETLFFLGVDNSIIPMGEIVGNASNKMSKMFVLILFGFIFGFFATLAEPDVSVLAGQVELAGVNVSKLLFIFLIAGGVGLAVGFALFRIIARLNYKIVLILLLLVTIGVSFFVNESVLAIAFDAGGATTGIITSPFLIAIASGVSQSKTKEKTDDAFGVVGIVSLGPVIALLMYFCLAKTSGTAVAEQVASETVKIGGLVVSKLEAASLSILPLMLIFFIFEVLFVKLPKTKRLSLLVGGVVTFIGLVLFLFGLDYGFSAMGKELGNFIKTTPSVVAIIFCAGMGLIVCFTEPAVKILGHQIEDVSGGHIKSKLVVFSIAISMCLAVCLGAIKIIFDVSFLLIIGVCYAIAVLAMFFSGSIFTKIGFDSGGVASGPISASFILPMMIGMAGGTSGFGVIALISVMPIIVLQILGIIYRVKLSAITRQDERRALAIAYQLDMLSDISKLKKQVEAVKKQKQEASDE